MKNGIIAVFIAVLSGCGTNSVRPDFTGAPLDAKIRISRFSNVYVANNGDCSKAKSYSLNGNGWFHSLDDNISLGMPMAEDSPEKFHEYAIPSGKPLSFEFSYVAGNKYQTYTCGPVWATFTPKPGGLYEAGMFFKDDGSFLFKETTCYTVVRKLTPASADPTKATAEEIPFEKYYKSCAGEIKR